MNPLRTHGFELKKKGKKNQRKNERNKKRKKVRVKARKKASSIRETFFSLSAFDSFLQHVTSERTLYLSSNRSPSECAFLLHLQGVWTNPTTVILSFTLFRKQHGMDQRTDRRTDRVGVAASPDCLDCVGVPQNAAHLLDCHAHPTSLNPVNQ